MAEVDLLLAGGTTPAGQAAPPVREIVLVAQDLASYGRDRSRPGERAKAGPSPIAALTRAVSARVERTRLLYLYPSGLTDELIEAVLGTGVPYFDLSLQHVSRPLLARMRRWGDGDRFLRRIADIRAADAQATFRSSFILGYPGETERDHDRLLEFLAEAQLDWAGFFPFSNEAGRTPPPFPIRSRPSWPWSGCASVPSCRTGSRRPGATCWSGQRRQVLVDAPGRGRTVHEAPEIDGIVHLPGDTVAGDLLEVEIAAAVGPDLYACRRPTGERHGEARPATRRFGPTALATPANAVTIARLLAAPVFVAMIVVWGATWFNVAAGLIVAGSDGLDGYIARRQGTTRSGAFLDPLADKAVVLGALFALAIEGHLPWWPVAIIAVREVGMQIYRSWAGRRGVSIPARNSAKLKTFVQDLAIGTCLIPPLAHHHGVQVAVVWVAAALTVITGVQYLADGRRAFKESGA